MSQFAIVNRKTGVVEEIFEKREEFEELPEREGVVFVHDPQRTVWIGAIWDGYMFLKNRDDPVDNTLGIAREKRAAWEAQRHS